MKNQQAFKLIDGKFSPNDSRELLHSVFSSKIQFHKMINFSSQERFGREDETAMTRIPQLQKSLEEILQILEAADNDGQHLQIKSDIVVSFIDPTKNV